MRPAAAVTAVLAVSCLAACGSDEPALSGALDSVSPGPAAERSFAWSDVGAIRDQAGDLPSGDFSDDALRRWLTPLSVGAPLLAKLTPETREAAGLDPYDIGAATTLGGGDAGFALRLDDANVSVLHSEVAKQTDGETELGDRYVLELGPDTEAPARLDPDLRYAYIHDESAALATDAQALGQILGDGETTLADRAGYAAAAECLGDVVSATILPAAGLSVRDADLVATGTRGGDNPTDVLCAIGDEAQAAQAADALRATLQAEGADLYEGFDIEIDEGGSGDAAFARAVVTISEFEPLGVTTEALTKGLVSRWLAG